MAGFSNTAYVAAENTMISVIHDWESVPLYTQAVGNSVQWFIVAEVRLMCHIPFGVSDLVRRQISKAFANLAGSLEHILLELWIVCDNMCHDLRLFTVEDWLSRFPGFMDNLALCLCAYVSGYHQSFENALADSNGPPEERNVLRDLLSQLWFMHNNNPELVEDYKWFCEHLRLALSEIEATWSWSSSLSSEVSRYNGSWLDSA